MTPSQFVDAFREAFGPAASLPLVCWYSDREERAVPRTRGCFFQALAEAREGRTVSLNGSNIGCGGGRFYAGFGPMPEYVPTFVACKEHYKQSPDDVQAFIRRLGVADAPAAWLHFARVDRVGSFDGKAAMLFFATPDVLSGLAMWAAFDGDREDAVVAPYGSGCSAFLTEVVAEQRRGGSRCFIGLFDPSVRPWVGANEVGFSIPMGRFRTMCGTMHATFLHDSHAWAKVRERINRTEE